MTMTIGALARRTGVPVKALREYEAMGLIYTVGRSSGNYRLFDDEALWAPASLPPCVALGSPWPRYGSSPRPTSNGRTRRSGRGSPPPCRRRGPESRSASEISRESCDGSMSSRPPTRPPSADAPISNPRTRALDKALTLSLIHGDEQLLFLVVLIAGLVFECAWYQVRGTNALLLAGSGCHSPVTGGSDGAGLT